MKKAAMGEICTEPFDGSVAWGKEKKHLIKKQPPKNSSK